MDDDAAEFIAALLHSSTVAHFMHLSTDSFSAHKALWHYYEDIIELAFFTNNLSKVFHVREKQYKIVESKCIANPV
jgi:hypothetical protein